MQDFQSVSIASSSTGGLTSASNKDRDALLGTRRQKDPKTKQNVFIIFVIFLIVAAIGITVYFVFFKEDSQSTQSDTEFLTIKQPTSIYIHDGSDFVLHVDYCNFALFEQDIDANNQSINITLINLNTRCYCWSYSESTMIDVIPSVDNTDFDLNDYHCDIPGPTLYITNNITFNITLVNNMIGEALYDRHETRLWPDVTNLHTHGLHIDPIWDNVFIAVNPGETVVYHYKIPQDHYPGTHWYHPHIHGSTNYQLHGGMFGAMIVEETQNDDVIATDNDDNEEEMTEIILNFHYFYFYSDPFCDCDQTESSLFDEYTYLSSAAGPFTITSLCYDWCMMPADIRNVSGFEYGANSDISSPDNGLLEIMLLNGQYEPTIHLQSNKWYKLRMINANGMFYTQINWKNVMNNSDLCNIHLLGNDGIFFNKSRNIQNNPYYNQMIIAPGSRADVAIKCQFLSNFSGAIPISYSTDILDNPGIPRYTAENSTIFYIQIHENPDNKNANDLNELPYYRIPSFPDYLTIETNANITDICPCYTYDIPDEDYSCQWSFLGTLINGQSLNLSKPLLQICSNKIYEFEISGVHPIHIHNTAFQIQRDLPLDNGFMAMEGDWRDTVGINDGNFDIRYPTGHFTGSIIMHCHFLPHEDDGMLGYFEIIDCDQSPQCDA